MGTSAAAAKRTAKALDGVENLRVVSSTGGALVVVDGDGATFVASFTDITPVAKRQAAAKVKAAPKKAAKAASKARATAKPAAKKPAAKKPGRKPGPKASVAPSTLSPATPGAKRLKSAMSEAKIGNAALARKVGVSTNTIGNYRSGRSAPTADVAGKIEKELSADTIW